MTTPASQAIRLDRVSKAFGEVRVLDQVSVDVEAGTCCCVLGRSGTGKSVMLKHIIGLMSPDEGRVLVEGQDLARLDRRELSRARLRIGFLFQHAALFDSLTVVENVAFPLRRHTRLPEQEIVGRARGKLAQVGLEASADRMPGNLSGGMRKRAGLARAMALDPPILLVDEPSAGLDPVTSAEIDALLAALRRDAGATIVIVTHNITSARALGDELIFLHEGRVLERGTVAALEGSAHPMVRAFMASAGSTG
jgi:phospholipid/cholesterol/gamma-HCH transport system ATP-binding protein